MNRGDVTNAPWERLPPVPPPKTPRLGRPAPAPRILLHGLLGLRRTGAPWRDLPARDGPWRTVARRFERWPRAGVWQQRCAPLTPPAEADGRLDWRSPGVERPIIRAPQPAAGATQGAPPPTRGRRRGGFRPTIHRRGRGP